MTALGELRDRVASILDGVVEDGAVHAGPVDSVTPPAYMLVWGGGSWLTRITMCAHTARLQVICVAARIDPEPGYEQLEELTTAAIVALEAARIHVDTVDAPLPMELGGLTYQTARITLTQPVTLET